MYRENRLFRTYELSNLLGQQTQNIIGKIQSEKDEYLANINQDEYLKHIQTEFEITTPTLLEEQIYCETNQKKIEVRDHFDRGMIFIDGIEITVFIPFEGDKILLLCRANTWCTSAPTGSIQDNKILIKFQMPFQNAETFNLESQLSPIIKAIKDNIAFTDKDLNTFNSNIKTVAQNAINAKVSNYNKFNNLVKNIPYPIKRDDNVPMTFEIPQVVRKPKISKPEANVSKSEPEPTLSNEEYDHIIKICSDMSLVIERNPKVFTDIDEESLRTHFLVQLNGHYQGQATGETFNSIGKTDILIRNDNQNVFIAECKFWKGEQVYKDTIDQLLGYVTYRDTKTSILVFVRNKDFTGVLDKIQEITPTHQKFIRQDKSYRPPVESAYRYAFKNKNDENKEFLLTVIAFHLPDIKK